MWVCQRSKIISILKTFCSSSLRKTSRIGLWTTLLAAEPVVSTSNSLEKLKPPDPSTLTHTYLIKNSTLLTVDGATALLTQTVTAILEIREEYVDALERLIKLMEINLKVLGDESRENQVWDHMLTVKTQVVELKQELTSLQTMFSCAEKVTMAAAEAAHFSGAEYAGIAASERLQSAQLQLKITSEKAEELEEAVRLLEIRTIEETSKKAKTKSKKKEEND